MDVTAAPRPHSPGSNSKDEFCRQPRPTQAYYVPRKVLECGRGPLPPEPTRGAKLDVAATPKPRPLMAQLLPPPPSLIKEKEKQRNPSRKPQSQVVGKRRDSDKSTSPPSSTTSNGRKPKKDFTPSRTFQPQQPQQQPIYVQSSTPKSSYSSSRSSSSLSQLSPQSPKRTSMVATQLTTSTPRVVIVAARGAPTPATTQATTTSKYTLPRPNAFCPTTSPSRPEDGCICDRKRTHVLCKRCGYECVSRVQVVCGLHPMVMALNDLRECPNVVCRSVQLVEVAAADLVDSVADDADAVIEKIDLLDVA